MQSTAMRRFAGLSPLGPIFTKELRVTARRKRTYLLRTLYLAALLLVLLAAWTGSRSYGSGVAAQTQLMAELGRNFFSGFLFFSTIAMAVIGPILTCTAISSERLAKTLNVLLMTPINTWQIVAGKLISRVWIALTLLGLSLPALALVRLLGGVELEQLIAAVCLAAVVAIHTAALGLLFSTIVNRAYVSILLSYLSLLFLEGFIPMVLVGGLKIGAGRGGETMWAVFNWFACTIVLTEKPGGATFSWVGCLIFYLALAAVFVALSGVMLRRFTRRSGAKATSVDPSTHIPLAAPVLPPLIPADPQSSTPPALNSPAVKVMAYAAPGARRMKDSKIRDVSDHPILWREIRRPLTSKRWQTILLGGGCIVLLLIAYAVFADHGEINRRDYQIGFAIVFNGLIWLLISVISATAIAQEKESDTWTLLLTTPLSGKRIVWGKVVGLLRRMMWPYLLVLAHFTLFTLTGGIPAGAAIIVLWVTVSFNMIWIATGVYLSLRLRKVTTAVILNLLLAILIYALPAMLLQIAGETLTYDRGTLYAEQVCWYLPYTYLGTAIEHVDNGTVPSFWLPHNLMSNQVRLGNRRYYDLPQNDVSQPLYFTIVFAVGIVYLIAAALLIQWTALRFDQIVHRSPQRRSRRQRILPPAAPVLPQVTWHAEL